MVAEMRSRMSLFVVGLSSQNSLEGMIIGDMGITLHVNQVKKDKLNDREEFQDKRAKTSRNEFGKQKCNAKRSYFQRKKKGPARSSASAPALKNKSE